MKFHGRFLKNSKFCKFSEFYVLTCKTVAILMNLGINIVGIYKKCKNCPKNFYVISSLDFFEIEHHIAPKHAFKRKCGK